MKMLIIKLLYFSHCFLSVFSHLCSEDVGENFQEAVELDSEDPICKLCIIVSGLPRKKFPGDFYPFGIRREGYKVVRFPFIPHCCGCAPHLICLVGKASLETFGDDDFSGAI